MIMRRHRVDCICISCASLGQSMYRFVAQVSYYTYTHSMYLRNHLWVSRMDFIQAADAGVILKKRVDTVLKFGKPLELRPEK